jgi:uncharacterized protein (TIGR03086 family)
MADVPDLGPACRTLAELVTRVRDDQLDGPTPNTGMRLGALLDHVSGLSLAFAAAARKETGGITARSPQAGGGPDAANLGPDWRRRLAAQLDDLALAWADPAAWTGRTQAGGVDLDGGEAGIIALDEVVVHGWDVAVASGQPYAVDADALAAVHEFVSAMAAPEHEAMRAGLFGPIVPVPDESPLLDRVIGLTGRDPRWTPA